MTPFGQRLRQLRIAAGLTQQELADRSRLSVDAISALETGRREVPRRDTFAMLVAGLGLGPADRDLLAATARARSRPRPAPASVFLSHTADLRQHPEGRSFAAAAEAAAIRAGHAVSNMAYFAARDTEPADYCTSMVAGADIYVGIIGLRYGAHVIGRPELSHTELEFETASTFGLPRLVFLVREDAPGLPDVRQPAEHGARQRAFRRRLRRAGVTLVSVSTPAELELALYQALVELRAAPRQPARGAPGPRAVAARRATLPAPGAGPRGWLPVPRRSERPGPRRRGTRLAAIGLALLMAGGFLVARSRVTGGCGLDVPFSAVQGIVEFAGSQAQPASEYHAMVADVLSCFPGLVDFDSQQGAATDIQTILDAQAKGTPAIDLTDMTVGEMRTLAEHDALQDLTPLLARLLRDRGFPQALVDYGRFDTDRQYSVPWLQATYLLVVNTKALKYLPANAHLDHLTYDDLIRWGRVMRERTGSNRIGLPADLGPRGGLLHRFLQGYLYPSFTGTTLTGFRSPEAVRMWETMRDLWAVTNEHSISYQAMQEPLETGEVWVAWDHQARLQGALEQQPDQYVVVPAPSGPKGLGFMTAPVNLAIPRGAANAAGAQELIDWLTRPEQQARASAALGFSPTVDHVTLAGAPAQEAGAIDRYRSRRGSIETVMPAGLGDRFNQVYKETFQRIVRENEDIRTVLDQEAVQLQKIVNDAHAPCWKPDMSSQGQPCQIA